MPKNSKTCAISIGEYPVAGDFSTFPEWERALFESVREDLRCPTCGCTDLQNKGVGGNPNQGGFRTTSVICTAPECKTSAKLSNVLDQLGMRDLLDIHTKNLNAAISAALATPQYKPTTSKKTKRCVPDLDEHPRDLPVSNTYENDTEMSEPDVIAKLLQQVAILNENFKTLSAGVEENKLNSAAELNKLHSIIEENEKLKSELSAARKEIEELKAAQTTATTSTKTRKNISDDYNRHMRKVHFETLPSLPKESNPLTNNPEKGPTFATIAAKEPPKMIRKKMPKFNKEKAVQLFLPPPPPKLYSKIHLQMPYNRELRKHDKQAKAEYLKAAIEGLGIKKHIAMYSRIGNSILEIYLPTANLSKVTDILSKKHIKLIDYDPKIIPSFATKKEVVNITIKRLQFLLTKARAINLKNCIKDGHCEAVLAGLRYTVSESDEMLTVSESDMMMDTTTTNDCLTEDSIL